MKTNQITVILLVVMGMIMGCKKYNFNPKEDVNVKNEKPIKPKGFVNGVDNKYFPLIPGDTLFYRNTVTENGETVVQDIYVATTHDIKVILGASCTVVHDYVTDHATGNLLEDTYDYYAQDHNGDVWYFGEDTKRYDPDGTISTEGTFIAGVDGAKAGIIMPNNPHYHHPYYQEYYVGHAEDQGVNLSTNNTVTIGYGTFTNCLKTKEYTVIDPGVIENKWYAPGIGLIQTNVTIGGDEHEELLRVGHE